MRFRLKLKQVKETMKKREIRKSLAIKMQYKGLIVKEKIYEKSINFVW